MLVVTDQRLAIFALSGLGRPKTLTASLGRERIASVEMGETALFGQKMPEVIVTTVDGAALGFGVAKVHRKHGDAVVAALG